MTSHLASEPFSVAARIGLLALFIAAAGVTASSAARAGGAHHQRGPVVTHLTEFGSDDFVTGSTIGPDGALYVTDGSAGEVLRINRRDGRVSTYASGLPPKAFQGQDIGGPVDVAFMGKTAYVLVTLVSGLIFGEPFDNGNPNAKNGLYRIERDGTATLIADLGQWSADHPPKPAFFVDTGVQFAMQPFWGGFLITDGHHNRVLWVSQGGSILEVATFGNVVPTGLETIGGLVLVTQMGPIPHTAEDGKILVGAAGWTPHELTGGASMLIDVEWGPRRRLYGLSQGQWDGVGEGSRAIPSTGRLLVVGHHGELTPVADDRGQELVLDRPVSMEFVGNTAYIVSVTGDVYRIENL